MENGGNAGKAGNCWQGWKLLARLEIAGKAGNCWQGWKLLARLEIAGKAGKKMGDPFPAFQQSGSRDGGTCFHLKSGSQGARAHAVLMGNKQFSMTPRNRVDRRSAQASRPGLVESAAGA